MELFAFHDDFWVVSMDDDGTLLVPDLKRNMVYKVLGVCNAIYPMLQSRGGFRRPVLVRLTTIPFFGRLVYDCVITGTMMQATVVSNCRKKLGECKKRPRRKAVSLITCDSWRYRVEHGSWRDCRNKESTWPVVVLLLLLMA
jgi:hypothetical protein